MIVSIAFSFVCCEGLASRRVFFIKTYIKELISAYIREYQRQDSIQTGWGEPLVAFADALDPRFQELKSIVSPSHALPQDFLPDARTVIAYFIPFAERIIVSNVQDGICSREWAVAYIETNQLIHDLNRHMAEQFAKMGYQSTIIPATHNFDQVKLISDWSHRHVAYLAGLGKFGLNNMLITAKGSGGRIGSTVTNLKIEPDPIAEGEYCLYKAKGSCKKCVQRCVGKALTVDSFDRRKCYALLLENDKIFPDLGLSDVCGQCVVNLPCTFTNPMAKIGAKHKK